MGMYIYVTADDIKRMKEVNSDKQLNDLFQEALQVDSSLLIDETNYYTPKRGYKGWLLGQKEENFRYTIYQESPSFDGSPYQALHMYSTSKNSQALFNYLVGIINGGSAMKLKLSTNKSEEDGDQHR